MLDRDRKVRTSPALWIPVIWVLVVILAPRWLPTATQNATQALEGNPAEGRIYTGLLAIGGLVLVGRRREVLTLLRMNGPIILFFLYCALSIMWSDVPSVASRRWIKSLGDLVMVMLILTDTERSTAVKRFLARTGFLLVPASVLLIRYYPALGATYFFNGKRQIVGVTNDKNLLGAVCLVFGLGALWRVVHSLGASPALGSRRTLVAQGVLLVMALWLFVKANSMTSISCFALASGVIIATSIPALARRRAVVHLLVASALGVAFLALFLDVGASLVETLGRDATLTGRTELWDEVLVMTGHPLFGTGFESFWTGPRLETLWARHWSHPNEAHNGYIEVFLNLGWMGIGLLAVVIATAYRNALGMLRRDQEAGGLRLAYFTVVVCYSFTEAGFRLLNPVWFSFLLAAFAVPEGPVLKVSAARDAVLKAAHLGRLAPLGPRKFKPGEAVGYKPFTGSLGR